MLSYYDILDRQNEQLKTLIHYEKNHLIAIKSLSTESEIKDYVDTLIAQIKDYSFLGNTENKILDLTVNKYKYICETENIDFFASIKNC